MIKTIELIIAAMLLLTGFFTGNMIIALMGAALIMLYFVLMMKKQKLVPAPEGEAVKYKHTVVSAEPPHEHVLTPAELGAPFHPLLEKSVEGKKTQVDAFPIFRGDAKNPAVTLFNAIPFNPFRKLWEPKKDKKEK
ncbi:MAG: hypothetical protein QXO69_02555 [archaeon]